MRKEGRTLWRRWNCANEKRFFATGPDHRPDRQNDVSVHDLSQRSHPPSGRRNRAVAIYEDQAHLRRSKEALAPPNPKEFVRANSNPEQSVVSRTTENFAPGSGSLMAGSGGSHCPRRAIKQATVSTAPAAPRRWPMPALVELTRILETASPAQRLIAEASAL